MQLAKLFRNLVSKDKTVIKSSTPPNNSNRSGYYVTYRTANIQSLKGIGDEQLLDRDGNIIALFYDGQLMCHCIRTDKGEENTMIVGAA